MSRWSTPTPMPVTLRVLDGLSRLLLWGVLVLGVAMGLRQALAHTHTPVRGVVVVGDTAHQTAHVLRPYLHDAVGANFWSLDLGAVAQSVTDAPWVRHVSVQRDFPNRLRLRIEEHQAVAWWGEANGNRLVNQFGEIFEAPLDDEQVAARLPVLNGPLERSADILRAYAQLQTRLQGSDLQAQAMRLTPHGSWQATLNDNINLALGRDDVAHWADKVSLMTATLSALRGHYDQTPRSIDLRYPNGFAVSLQGVSVGPQL